jgi:diguanylate cyclase (GGDEF)-like protein/PAS domain S-box-containing protein
MADVIRPALRITALWKRSAPQILWGACLAALGVLLVEALFIAGLRPLGPMAWPGLGALIATALGGAAGLAGGSLVLGAYYLFNFLQPHRFPEFYSHPYNTISWLVALGLLAAVILATRPRLLRAAAAEAELAARRQYERALRDSEERLHVIADSLPAFVSYIDTDQRYRFNNRAYEDWLSIPRSEITGRTVREIWGEERYAALRPNIERALRGERVDHEYTVLQGGVERRIMASYVPDINPKGEVGGFFVLGSDITQLAAARSELRAQHARLEAALDGSNVALWDTDLRTRRVYLSEAWAEIVGAPRGNTVVGLDELLGLLHPDDLEPVKRVSLEVMKGTRPSYAIEHRVRTRDGEWRWIMSRGRVTERDPATGRALRMIGTNVDITDRRRMEEALQSVAQTDPLTGLANRLLFRDRLQLAQARARRGDTRIALLYLDIDRFKEINDQLGHAAGDTVLKDFAVRLRAGVRATDTVARFGGDEFVVLLEDVKDPDDAMRVAEKILAECRQPLALEGREVLATVSVGVAYCDGSADEEHLLRRADAALYEAKSAGRDGYRVARGGVR